MKHKNMSMWLTVAAMMGTLILIVLLAQSAGAQAGPAPTPTPTTVVAPGAAPTCWLQPDGSIWCILSDPQQPAATVTPFVPTNTPTATPTLVATVTPVPTFDIQPLHVCAPDSGQTCVFLPVIGVK